MLSKEAIEYLYNLGVLDNPIVNTVNGQYTRTDLTKITEPIVKAIEVRTLTGLIDFIKSNFDDNDKKILIHVETPTCVSVKTPLNSDKRRNTIITATAITPRNVEIDRYINTEDFNIMLQSAFVPNKDRDVLLKYTGLVQDETVKSLGDDGVKQQVTIKTGVASVGQAEVPNPVILAPYRTFQEIEQVESKFVFRMKSGPTATLIEADGGKWKNETMKRIKVYLEEELKDVENKEIIA